MDCLLIGFNEVDFSKEKIASQNNLYQKKMIDIQYITYNNVDYTAKDLFNHFHKENKTKNFIPLGIGDSFSNTISYLGSYLQKRGFSFDYISTFDNHKNDLIKKLNNKNLLTVAITTTFYFFEYPIIEIVNFIRKYNSKVKIIAGGPFISIFVKRHHLNQNKIQETFKNINADFYVYNHEGEATLAGLIGALKNNLPINEIDNIFYKIDDKYIFTKSSNENNNLEEEVIDWTNFKETDLYVVNIRTSKSCPFKCSFCNYPQTSGKYTTVSVDCIERELDTIKKMKNVSGVLFIDDTLNFPMNRFKQILQMIIRNKYNFKWCSYIRCQYLDDETVKLMKESGCEYVFLGIESGNQKILNAMNKNVRVGDYKRGIKLLNKYGIFTVAGFIIGFPGETTDTYQDTVNFIEECKPTFFRTSIWACIPFSPIFKNKEQYGIRGIGFEWMHSTMDSNKAIELEYEIMKNIKNSIWVKHYGMDAFMVFSMICKGYSIQWIKEYLQTFNECVKEKLKSETNKEMSTKNYEKFKYMF